MAHKNLHLGALAPRWRSIIFEECGILAGLLLAGVSQPRIRPSGSVLVHFATPKADIGMDPACSLFLLQALRISFFRCQLCKRLLRLEQLGAIAFAGYCQISFGHLLGSFARLYQIFVSHGPNNPQPGYSPATCGIHGNRLHEANRRSPAGILLHAQPYGLAGIHTEKWVFLHSHWFGTTICMICWWLPSRIPSIPAAWSHPRAEQIPYKGLCATHHKLSAARYPRRSASSWPSSAGTASDPLGLTLIPNRR